jgi:hypothetical protein
MEWFQCRSARSEAAVLQALEHARAAGARRTPGARRIENQCLYQRVGALLYGPAPVEPAAAECAALMTDAATPERVRIGASMALAALRAMEGGEQAAHIADVRTEPPGMVLVETAFGGRRVMDQLVGDPLPRIC